MATAMTTLTVSGKDKQVKLTLNGHNREFAFSSAALEGLDLAVEETVRQAALSAGNGTLSGSVTITASITAS
jgi:hypothetical protein